MMPEALVVTVTPSALGVAAASVALAALEPNTSVT
jgi:hypothetical protein